MMNWIQLIGCNVRLGKVVEIGVRPRRLHVTFTPTQNRGAPKMEPQSFLTYQVFLVQAVKRGLACACLSCMVYIMPYPHGLWDIGRTSKMRLLIDKPYRDSMMRRIFRCLLLAEVILGVSLVLLVSMAPVIVLVSTCMLCMLLYGNMQRSSLIVTCHVSCVRDN